MNKKSVENIINSVCVIAREQFESHKRDLYRSMTDLHQEDADKGRGFQGATIKNYVDLVEKVLADDADYLSNQIEKALFAAPMFYAKIDKDMHNAFANTLPAQAHYFQYLDQFPENTGQPEYFNPKIEEIRKPFDAKRERIIRANREQCRQLGEKLKSLATTRYDRFVRFCKDRPYLFIPYQLLLAVAAFKGLNEVVNFVNDLISK